MADTNKSDTPDIDDIQKTLEKQIAELRKEITKINKSISARGAEMLDDASEQASDATRSKANDAYIRSIQSKIRGNVVLPPDIPGNPEAIFDVVQLPTGEIIDARLRKSSGVRAYDDALQRAILKSSPLPKPEPELFQRSLTLRFRPLD